MQIKKQSGRKKGDRVGGNLTKRIIENADSEFISEAQLLARVPVSRMTLLHWRNDGKIPFIRLSGKRTGRVVYHWPVVRDTLIRQQQLPRN